MRSPQTRVTVPLPALSELDLVESEKWAIDAGHPAYRGRQLYQALGLQGAQSVEDIHTLPASLRDLASKTFRTRTLEVRFHLRSRFDRSEKVLFGLHDGGTVESVLIRAHGSTGKERNTVCVSSQVGCPAGCTFCATGLGGFSRNLSAGEIADQVMYFVAQLRGQNQRVSNVVFMGMGEPLLNVSAVRKAATRLTDTAGLNMGERHITVSTVGIVPQIRKFAEWAGQINLAISLHAPNDGLRSELVPYNQHFPIAELMDAVGDYVQRTRRRVSFEYVLLHGKNDSLALAQELASLLRPLAGMAHVNLIPWNPFREGKFVRSEGPDADAFATALIRGGVNATIRYSKGLDISAACGQLREREHSEPIPLRALNV